MFYYLYLMAYRELLLDPLWQARKEKIIVRDGIKCTVCNNFNLVKNCLAGLLFFHGENYDGKLFGFYGYNKKGLLINHKVFVKRYLNIIPLNGPNGHVVYIDEESENGIFAKMVAIRDRQINDYDQLVLTPPNGTAEGAFKLQNHAWQNYKWRVAPALHVNHLYYRKSFNPWDYPDEALQTICWECHEQLNKNKSVPYLNETGIQIRTINPCKKCYGAGFLPGYQEADEAICDRCNGARYEEFL